MCFEGKAKELLGFVLYFISLCKRKNPELNVKTSCLPRDSGRDIHSKSEKVCGVCFSVTKKSAEKVRKSQHKNFVTKVRKSIKKSKNAQFESKM